MQNLAPTRVLWLDVMFRHHEVCWRKPRSPDEIRIFSLGNSASYGFPYPHELSAFGLINENYKRRQIRAHIFNLGFMGAYQMKEAMILAKALPYKPDFIIYAASLSDWTHVAPLEYPPMYAFWDANSRVIAELAADPPPTFEEPFRLYRDSQANNVRPYATWIEFRQIGTFVRLAVAEMAQTLRRMMFPSVPFEKPFVYSSTSNRDWRCESVLPNLERQYVDWKKWSMLDVLADLRDETGIEVLVVNWPVDSDRRGDCFNIRFPAETFQEYVRWTAMRSEELGLPYLDLHDYLDHNEFFDSVHPNVRGQRKMAARMSEKILSLLPRRSVVRQRR